VSARHGPAGRLITIPRRSLVLLIGVSGSGKSTFAREHFGQFQTISSDYCRGLVSDDEADQGATTAAFRVLHYIVEKRLDYGRLTVVDATNVELRARRELLAIARDHHFKTVGIVFDVDADTAMEQNAERLGRVVPDEVIEAQHKELQALKSGLAKEFDQLYVLKGSGAISAVRVSVEG
jgi:protein phosphatase